MSVGELACTYAALILHDDGIAVTAEKISTIVKTAKVNVESYWPSLFAKLCEKNIEDLILTAGSGGGGASFGGGAAVTVTPPPGEEDALKAPAPAPETKPEDEDSDDDLMTNLFD